MSHLEYAGKLLREAVELEGKDKFPEALTCYLQGIEALMKAVAESPKDERRAKLEEKISGYMKRAEGLKERIERDSRLNPPGETKRRHHTSIAIPDNAIGYETVFDSYMRTAKKCIVRDGYLRRPHQIHNLLRFCELCVLRSFTHIQVITGSDEGGKAEQEQMLGEVASSLKGHGITLTYTFDSSLHDRDITFNNGWMVRLGRGLDYFKRAEGFSVGYHEMDLRPCYQVNIDVWQELS